MKKRDWLWMLGAVLCFAAAYLLCRFAFFSLHGMKQWPNILAAIGLAILLIALFFKKRITAVATILGYLGGFALGILLQSSGLDQGGGATNNLWIIWTVAFLICTAIGVIADIVVAARRRIAQRRS